MILKIAVLVPVAQLFDYQLPDTIDPNLIQPGLRVEVPFGRTNKVGFIVEIVAAPPANRFPLKFIHSLLDREPLWCSGDWRLLQWASRYYHYPLSEVIACALPTRLRQARPAAISAETVYRLTACGRQAEPEQLKNAPKQQALLAELQARDGVLTATAARDVRPALKALLKKGLVDERQQTIAPPRTQPNPVELIANDAQQAAIDQISAQLGRFSVCLLEGVTGSGKTEVYMQVIGKVLEQGLQVLVLLPEIALTPQLLARFQQRFAAPIVSYHSQLTDLQRANAWLNMREGHAAILLGTRSATFTPLNKPGLMILDEEHDASFKQHEGFRFSARDVAIVRAKYLNIPVVLGSATPSLESLFNAQQGRYHWLHLPARAGNALPPVLQLVDIRNQKLQQGLSAVLIDDMRKTLADQQQVLLFLNRRGYAPVLMCNACGWVARCANCDANLVVHHQLGQLRCHHCDARRLLVKTCPACHANDLQAIGIGTQRLEATLTELFPNQRVLRLDRDSTQRKGTLEQGLQQINAGEADIILGTQMLAKGHHFAAVTLVALLDVDGGLFSVDFHSTERLAQLIVQVAGRAGRAEQPGRVILQTRQPYHPLLLTLLQHGYRAFAEAALNERKQAQLPPFSHQALLRVQGFDDNSPQAFLNVVKAWLDAGQTQGVLVLGPVPAPMMRRLGQFRYQLLLQSPSRPVLHGMLDELIAQIPKFKEARQIYWSLDVDPIDLY